MWSIPIQIPFEVFSFILYVIFIHSRVAQSAERQAVNLDVVGSSPTAGAIAENRVKAHEVVE